MSHRMQSELATSRAEESRTEQSRTGDLTCNVSAGIDVPTVVGTIVNLKANKWQGRDEGQ